MPSVVLAGPFLPALAQRASFSNGHGIDGEFLEVSHKTAARSLARQAGDGFHVPRDVGQTFAVDRRLLKLTGMVLAG